jgi:hypothetical protein
MAAWSFYSAASALLWTPSRPPVYGVQAGRKTSPRPRRSADRTMERRGGPIAGRSS